MRDLQSKVPGRDSNFHGVGINVSGGQQFANSLQKEILLRIVAEGEKDILSSSPQDQTLRSDLTMSVLLCALAMPQPWPTSIFLVCSLISQELRSCTMLNERYVLFTIRCSAGLTCYYKLSAHLPLGLSHKSLTTTRKNKARAYSQCLSGLLSCQLPTSKFRCPLVSINHSLQTFRGWHPRHPWPMW